MGLRPQTTVAPQALLLMNNKLIRAAALDWAKKLESLPLDAAVTRAYLAALARSPTSDELATAVDFLSKQTTSYQNAAKPEAAHLALADFCQAVVSMNEFVYVE